MKRKTVKTTTMYAYNIQRALERLIDTNPQQNTAHDVLGARELIRALGDIPSERVTVRIVLERETL